MTELRYRLLGGTGIRVSEMALGTMTFGTAWGWGADRDACAAILDAYVEAGGNFIDTASNYTNGESEAIVGQLLQRRRDRFVVATKYTLTLDAADPNAGGNHRKSLRRALEQSLRRLQTDYVDLLWLHMWDGMTSLEHVLYALDAEVRSGKVLQVGFSDTPAWIVSEAFAEARRNAWALPTAVQAPYSLSSRDLERDLLPMATAHAMAAVTWGALDGGMLTGKYGPPASDPRRYGDASLSQRRVRTLKVVSDLAAELGATRAQICLAWLMEQRTNGWNLIPIIGARTAAQLREDLGAATLRLTPDQIGQLDAASDFKLGFPREFLEDNEVIELIHGRNRTRIDA